jgi:hypothetical protein
MIQRSESEQSIDESLAYYVENENVEELRAMANELNIEHKLEECIEWATHCYEE